MARLETLPNELLLQIASYLPKRDLVSTSRVSHRLHSISLPALYLDPHLVICPSDRGTFFQFLRTLLTPDGSHLAPLVHRLLIHWASRRKFHTPHGVPPLTSNGGQRLTPAGHITHLLGLLPRLSALHLTDQRSSGECALSWHSTDVHVPLPHDVLRKFANDNRSPGEWAQPKDLVALLQLPHIRAVQLPHQRTYDFDAAAFAAAAGTSPLAQLALPAGSLGARYLRGLLALPRALTHLRVCCSLGEACAFGGGVMLPVRHSLRSLFIQLQRVNRFPERLPGALGSLREWPALRSVRCPLVLLLGEEAEGLAHVLPPGLRELEVFDLYCTSVTTAAKEVLKLLLAGSEAVPRLETVAVCSGRRKPKWLRRRLKKACWAADVALQEQLFW